MAKKRAEDAFEGFKKKLYCWVRRERIMCAVHKVLYYDMSAPILEDKQYDYMESRLEAVEKRHPDIASAVKAEGFLSPGDYVDSLRIDALAAQARVTYEMWQAEGSPRLLIPDITPEHTAAKLYAEALPMIGGFPI